MNKKLVLVVTAACSLFPMVSASQSGPVSATPSPLLPIYACAEKTDAAERLACFDTAVAAIKAAEARSDIVAIDRPRAAAVRREAFGFRMPSLARFGLGNAGNSASAPANEASQARDEQIDEQTFAVARVGTSGGRVAIFLENGNVWHLIDTGEFNAPSRTPFNVRIRAAALNSYILQVEGRNKGYRVRRVE